MLVVDSALTIWKISSLKSQSTETSALGLIAKLLKIRLECWFLLNCCCADSLLQQMRFTHTFMTLFPPDLRYVNGILFTACLHSALHLITYSIRAGSSLQRACCTGFLCVRVLRYFKEGSWIKHPFMVPRPDSQFALLRFVWCGK